MAAPSQHDSRRRRLCCGEQEARKPFLAQPRATLPEAAAAAATPDHYYASSNVHRECYYNYDEASAHHESHSANGRSRPAYNCNSVMLRTQMDLDSKKQQRRQAQQKRIKKALFVSLLLLWLLALAMASRHFCVALLRPVGMLLLHRLWNVLRFVTMITAISAGILSTSQKKGGVARLNSKKRWQRQLPQQQHDTATTASYGYGDACAVATTTMATAAAAADVLAIDGNRNSHNYDFGGHLQQAADSSRSSTFPSLSRQPVAIRSVAPVARPKLSEQDFVPRPISSSVSATEEWFCAAMDFEEDLQKGSLKESCSSSSSYGAGGDGAMDAAQYYNTYHHSIQGSSSAFRAKARTSSTRWCLKDDNPKVKYTGASAMAMGSSSSRPRSSSLERPISTDTYNSKRHNHGWEQKGCTIDSGPKIIASGGGGDVKSALAAAAMAMATIKPRSADDSQASAPNLHVCSDLRNAKQQQQGEGGGGGGGCAHAAPPVNVASSNAGCGRYRTGTMPSASNSPYDGDREEADGRIAVSRKPASQSTATAAKTSSRRRSSYSYDFGRGGGDDWLLLAEPPPPPGFSESSEEEGGANKKSNSGSGNKEKRRPSRALRQLVPWRSGPMSDYSWEECGSSGAAASYSCCLSSSGAELSRRADRFITNFNHKLQEENGRSNRVKS